MLIVASFLLRIILFHLSWLFRFASPQATNLHNKQGLRCFYLFLGTHLSETAILHGTDSKTKLSEKQ